MFNKPPQKPYKSWLDKRTAPDAATAFAAERRAAAIELHSGTMSFDERVARITGKIVNLPVAFQAPHEAPKPPRKPHFKPGELEHITANLRAALRP